MFVCSTRRRKEMKSTIVVLVFAVIGFAGCSKKQSAPPPAPLELTAAEKEEVKKIEKFCRERLEKKRKKPGAMLSSEEIQIFLSDCKKMETLRSSRKNVRRALDRVTKDIEELGKTTADKQFNDPTAPSRPQSPQRPPPMR
jgi:hypothetical protein